MKFGGREARREGGGVKKEGNPWPRSERKPRGAVPGAGTIMSEFAGGFLLLAMIPAAILWRRWRGATKAVASVRQTDREMGGASKAVKQTTSKEPLRAGDAAVVTPAQAHVARDCHQTAPQSTAQPVKTFPSSHLVSTETPPPPPSCEVPVPVPVRQPPSHAEVTLRPGKTSGPKARVSDATSQTIAAAKNSAMNGPPPSCEGPVRQPPSAVEVTLRQGPKPGPTAVESDAAEMAAVAAKKSFAVNSAYQKQIADLHEALQVSQKKMNVVKKELAAAKQAVVNASSARRQKGGEQRAAIVRLQDTLHEERNEFRNLRQRSTDISRALGEAEETKNATLNAFAKLKEEAEAKVARLSREASRTKELERQLARKEFELERLKEEVARLRSDAEAIEGLRGDVVSKDNEIERMKRAWWDARDEARKAKLAPCRLVERAAQDICACDVAPS